MRASHVLTAGPGGDSASAAESAAVSPGLAREFDHLIRGLTGFGYVASCWLAAVPLAALVFDAAPADAALAIAAWALLLSAAFASVHRLSLRRLARAKRDMRAIVLRHRSVLLLLGATSAWASLEWLRIPLGGMELPVAAFLVLQLGFGSTAAATDRPALAIWLTAVAVVPIAYLLLLDTEGRHVAVLLIAAAMAVTTLTVRIRQLVDRALRAREVNDRLVAQLRNQVALVEAANAEKSRFLGAASHDLRQPMHALGLFAAALEKELRGTQHHPKVMSMARAVDALEDSFGTMLDVSRLDAGVVHPNVQSFPIRDVFRRLYMHCAGHAEERGLSLRFKAGGKVVTSDPQLLERILGNLVNNAIRYTERGGIVVVARSRAGRTCIEVWDTGIGIAAEELPNIFNEFYQVGNRARDRSRGLGMGLSIVKRLVLLLGHELEVESTPGRGTVFRVLLRQTELSDLSTLVLGADTIPSVPDENRTILFIDDEEAVRAGMQELLSGWGFNVLPAASTAEACDVLRSHGGVIDMVVSDLRLGADDDGIDAIAEVRSRYGAPLPALLITGDTSPDEVKRAHDSGNPVLFKPVRPRDLFTALRNPLK